MTGVRAMLPRRFSGPVSRLNRRGEAFRNMPKTDRDALVKFVESL